MIIGIESGTFKNANKKAELAFSDKQCDLIDRLFRAGSPVLKRLMQEIGSRQIIHVGHRVLTKEELVYECYYAAILYTSTRYKSGGNYCSILYQKARWLWLDQIKPRKRVIEGTKQFLEHVAENPEDAF